MGVSDPPLPRRIVLLRERSISLFVANIHDDMSKAEIEAMFCRASKILDCFIPIDKQSGKRSGFAFVRFGSIQEAKLLIWLRANLGEEEIFKCRFPSISQTKVWCQVQEWTKVIWVHSRIMLLESKSGMAHCSFWAPIRFLVIQEEVDGF